MANHVRMGIFGHVHRYIEFFFAKSTAPNLNMFWKKFRRPPNNTFVMPNVVLNFIMYAANCPNNGVISLYASELYVCRAYYLQWPMNQQNYACWFKPISIFEIVQTMLFFTPTIIQKCPKVARTSFVSSTARFESATQTQFGFNLGHSNVTR